MPKRRGRAKSLDHQPTSSAPCELNTTRIDEVLRALPSYFLRHWPERSVGFRQMLQTYDSLAGWGRTRFQIVDGKLYYPNLKHNTFGCVLRRTPILAWALLQTLDRHNISDVDIPVNCRDTPGTPINQRLMRSSGSPPLSFSYTTAAGYADIPLPDFTYWGLPYANMVPWEAWLASTVFTATNEGSDHPSRDGAGYTGSIVGTKDTHVGHGSALSFKRDQMIWVGSPTNPLREAFQKCAGSTFGARLVHRMPNKEQMHTLAWRCPPGKSAFIAGAWREPCQAKPEGWTPLEEQCKYRYILHLPGISDWLEHFKHQLACGSVNIFIGRRPRHRAAFDTEKLKPPISFEHYDFTGPLLQEGETYLFVPATASTVCERLQATITQLEQVPLRAECVARRGQELAASLSMPRVYTYLAEVLNEASRRQKPEVARRVVAKENSRLVTKANFFSFVPSAKRPWMEHVFVPWHANAFNATPLLPPRGEETASGLFH